MYSMFSAILKMIHQLKALLPARQACILTMYSMFSAILKMIHQLKALLPARQACILIEHRKFIKQVVPYKLCIHGFVYTIYTSN